MVSACRQNGRLSKAIVRRGNLRWKYIFVC